MFVIFWKVTCYFTSVARCSEDQYLYWGWCWWCGGLEIVTVDGTMFFVLAKCCTVDSKCKDKYLHILCYLYIHTVVILCGYMWLRICLCICIYLFICMSFYVHTSWYKCLILYAIPAPLPKSAHRNDQSWFDGSIFGFLTLWSWRIHFQDVCVTQTKTGTKRRGPSLQEGVCVCIYVCETVFPLSGLLHRVFPSLCSGRCNWKELDLMGKRCIGRNVSLRWFLEQKLNPSQSQIDPNYIRVLLFFARNVGNSGEP